MSMFPLIFLKEAKHRKSLRQITFLPKECWKLPMLTYSIETNRNHNSLSVKTLHVEGEIKPLQKERLKRIIMDTLILSDHLILNIKKVEEFPPSFIDLVTFFRCTAKHMGKRFTVKGYNSIPFSSSKQSHSNRGMT